MTMADNAESPSVTICVPTYNAAATVGETLSSLLAQTYRTLRIIVVDNASSDETLEVAGRFAAIDERVTVLSFDENIGGEGNFTRCLQLADGDYAAIFHADDVYEPEMVAREVAFLERHPEVAAVFTRALLIDAQGAKKGESRIPALLAKAGGGQAIFGFREAFNAVLKEHNFFVCSSAMARGAVFREHVGKWDGDRFGSSADLGVWLRILEKYRVGIILEPLMRYRLSSGQGSVVLNRLRTAPADFFRVIDHYLAQEWVNGLVSPESLAYYQIHQARDLHIRVKNALIIGNGELARRLAREAWKPAMFTISPWVEEWKSCNLIVKTWCSGLFMSVLTRLPRQRLVGSLLYHYKYGRRARKLGG